MKDCDKPRWCRKGADKDFQVIRYLTAIMVGVCWLMVFVIAPLTYEEPGPALLVWSVFLVGFISTLWQVAFQYANQRDAYALARH